MTQFPRAVAAALLTVVLLIIGLALYGVLQQMRQPADEALVPTPLPLPQDTPLPTSAPRPTVDIPTTATHFTSSRSGYSLLIPTGWVVVDTTTPDGQAIVSTMHPSADRLQTAYRAFQQGNGVRAVELIAYNAVAAQPEQMPAILSIMTTPRHQLGLTRYLETVAEELAQFAPVETEVDHTLRADGLPTGILRFRAPGELYGVSGHEVVNTQALLIDRSGENFIVLTFATTARRLAQERPLWEEILGSIELH